MKILAIAAAFLLSGPASAASHAAKAALKAPFRKVLVIMLENADYSAAVSRPFLRKLTRRGATLTDYHGVAHPSLPNYIALITGDTRGVKNDDPVDLDGRQLGDLIESKGLSWAAYAEGYPGGCFLGASKGAYARKHVPFLSFKSVQKSPARCARVKDAATFDADAAGGLPTFSLYIPNLDDDGHDTDVDVADSWLAGFLGPKLDDPSFMSGLLVVVTFDEDSGTPDNHILTVLLGDGVTPGSTSGVRYDHVSLLKTVENAFHLGNLGRRDAAAAAIAGVWRS